jgi:AcrR family transcriptional regulator
MGRPRLHDETTERELLTAAEALLAAEGAEAISVRRLAEAAGTSARAIYSVFGDKAGLMRALFDEAFVALQHDLDALPMTDDPLADVVACGTLGFRKWALARPHLFHLVFDTPQRVERPPRPAESGVQAFDRLLARVRRCADAGLLPKGLEGDIGVAFHALCEGLAALEMRRRFPLTPERDAADDWDRALTALLNGFRR